MLCSELVLSGHHVRRPSAIFSTYYTMMFCSVPRCAVLCWSGLYCFVLHCTADGYLNVSHSLYKSYHIQVC